MREVVVVSAVRTAIGSIGGTLKDVQPEVLAKTELDYNGILAAVEELCANGHQIGIITVGRTAYRLYQAE